MYLKLKPNPAGGAHIVEKYSHRRPAMPSHLPPRPRTPSHASTTASGNIAAPSSPRRSRSPFGSPTRFPSSSGLEGLLGDAARAAYNRGERWGLNRAVRDAVGEVKKNVQAIQVSPRNSMHQRASSTDLFRKVQRLEKRNQALAAMLEEALGELWECQRRLAESLNKSSSTEPNEDHEEQQADAKDIDKKGLDRSTEKQAGDDLGIAIAKVQFIQVYLTDTTMPLPQEENPGRIEDVHEKQPPSKRTMNFDTSDSVEDALAEATANPHTSEKLSTASKKQAPSLPPPEILFDASAPSSSPEPSEAPSTAAQPIAIPSSSSSAIPSTKSSSPPPRPILTKSPPTVTTTAPTDVAFAPASRPSLEQSAFSYILGHDAADRQHAFAAAAPFSDEATRRSRVADRMGKGFLFGEDDEGKGKAEESPDRKSGAKGKPRNTLRKKPPASAASGDNSAAGRKGSVDAQGKGKGKTGDGGDEEIDLEAFSHHSSRS